MKVLAVLLFLVAFFIFEDIVNTVTEKARKKLERKRRIRKNLYGAHSCNKCEISFYNSDEELDYEYCPCCGERLTMHKDCYNPLD